MWVVLGRWGIILGGWGCMGHYFRWVGVNGALFWVGGGEWENILDVWGWVSGGRCTV